MTPQSMIVFYIINLFNQENNRSIDLYQLLNNLSNEFALNKIMESFFINWNKEINPFCYLRLKDKEMSVGLSKIKVVIIGK